MRWASIVWVLAVAAGCASPRYTLSRPDVPCDRSLRVAHRTMVALGYTVTEMVPPGQGPGLIGGTRTGPDGQQVSGRVQITCNARGVTLQPIESGPFSSYEFSRAFDYSFSELARRPDVEEPTRPVGLQVLVQVVDWYQQQLDLGGGAVGSDATLVRVTIRNHTDRSVTVSADGFQLAPAGGTAIGPLPSPGRAIAGGAAGDRVHAELLTRLTVPRDTSLARFLVYPAAQYREARIAIEDTETGETEGFVARVE